MKKNHVFIIIAIIVIAGIGWYFWQQHNSTQMNDGSVFSTDGSGSKAKMDQGAVDIDGKPMSNDVDSNGQYTNTATSKPALPNTVTAPGSTQNSGSTGSTASPAYTGSTTTSATSTTTYTPVNTRLASTDSPAGDTLKPDAPAGMAFGGRGKFQWYRQGNLTWRINTETGSSCVAFATMDEWAKSIVFTHGCGNA